jgi:catechol 2,3-dioxygenase-like lactoylglutathione lyase family enzyme
MSGESALEAVLETTLYCDASEREETERFYAEALGLRRVAGWPSGTAFRIGAGVLLLFEREGLAATDSPVAEHGSSGPGQVCLTARDGEYERWRERLARAGIAIHHDHEWPGGGRSFYFRDPAGNLLEIADRDIWPA